MKHTRQPHHTTVTDDFSESFIADGHSVTVEYSVAAIDKYEILSHEITFIGAPCH
jgi:hypothetical protein